MSDGQVSSHSINANSNYDEFELDNEITNHHLADQLSEAVQLESNISALSQTLSNQRDAVSFLAGKAHVLRERFGLSQSNHTNYLQVPQGGTVSAATSDTSSFPSTSNSSTPNLLPAEPHHTLPPQQPEQNVKYMELQKEVQILNQIIKQYESTLDIIMGKLRTQAVMAQREKLEQQIKLQKALDEERAISQSLRTDNAVLQTRLDDAFKAIREALGAASEDLVDVLATPPREPHHQTALKT